MTLPPIHGRGVTVDKGATPPGPREPRSIPLAGLISTAVVVIGLGLVVVGVWSAGGWPWGLVALGVAMLAIERWPEPKPPESS